MNDLAFPHGGPYLMAMSTLENAVTSPCVSVCTVDKATGLCIGCLRTLQEIGAWRTMTDDEKRATVMACAARAKTAAPLDRDRPPLAPKTLR